MPLSTAQAQRFEKVRELARSVGNLTLSVAEPHRNPYRDLSAKELAVLEKRVKHAFLETLPNENIPVLISADDHVRSAVNFDGAEKKKSSGRIVRLLVSEKRWFETNWNLFASDLGFGTRRSLFVFLKFDEKSLAKLVGPWWDPDVLLNPHVASSRALIKGVENQLEPGTIVFSLSLVRLRTCQLYFHPDDLDCVTTTVCTAAQKTKWWK